MSDILTDLQQAEAAVEIEALRKDAWRWRWLRDSEGAHAAFTAAYFNTLTSAELDAAIDAASAK